MFRSGQGGDQSGFSQSRNTAPHQNTRCHNKDRPGIRMGYILDLFRRHCIFPRRGTVHRRILVPLVVDHHLMVDPLVSTYPSKCNYPCCMSP